MKEININTIKRKCNQIQKNKSQLNYLKKWVKPEGKHTKKELNWMLNFSNKYFE